MSLVSRLRVGPFGLGLAAGLVVGAVALMVAPNPFAAPGSAGSGRPTPLNFRVVTTGTDLSRHGVRRVVIQGGRASVTQTCNDACDDLFHGQVSHGDIFRISLLDEAGAVVIPDGGQQVAEGEAPVEIRVAGAEALSFSKATPRQGP